MQLVKESAMTQLAVHDDLMGSDGKVKSFRFCCPIFITGMYGTLVTNSESLFPVNGAEPEIRSGTLTFVSYKGRTYGITCRHVVEALEGQNAKKHQEHLAIYGNAVPFVPEAQMHFFFPKEKEQIHINTKFYKAPGDAFTASYPDAAITRISPEKLAQIGREAISLEREIVASDKWSKAACGIATGYPEQNRRSISSNTPLSKMGVSTVIAIAPFERVSGTQITMFYELNEEPDADNLSGMSGGPILWSEEEGWGLLGIVKEGRDMKQSSSKNQNSFLTGHIIWIDGEPISSEVFAQWVAQIPEGDEPIKDLSKTLYVPSGHPAA
jgi:hypothetical protein